MVLSRFCIGCCGSGWWWFSLKNISGDPIVENDLADFDGGMNKGLGEGGFEPD